MTWNRPPLLKDCSILLEAVRAALRCEAVIVGGMLRDHDNGASVKDIDIFCFASDGEWNFDDCSKALLNIPGLEISSGLQMGYISRDEVTFCFTCTVPGISHEVQVILCEFPDAETLRNRVDFGICQISYDGVEVFRTQQYLDDQRDKVFRLVRCDNSEDRKRSMTRFNRFQLKYPEWTFVDSSVPQITTGTFMSIPLI